MQNLKEQIHSKFWYCILNENKVTGRKHEFQKANRSGIVCKKAIFKVSFIFKLSLNVKLKIILNIFKSLNCFNQHCFVCWFYSKIISLKKFHLYI